ncbi:MAG TPA: DUF4404 family protein [Steroidobacteraceae bacterium]|nr:DUF4404 family protein [Steroidobacteraceae bacterium]
MSDLQQKLHDLHIQLGEAHRLDPNDRAMLETVLGDFRRVLEEPELPASGGAEHGETLESSAVRLEASHPSLAGAIRAVLDALAKAGI